MFALRHWKTALLVLLVLATISFIWGIVLRGEYATRQSARREFILEDDFTVVRKILVRKDAAKQIVTMSGDSEFVSQQWSSVGADVETLSLLDPEWRLELHGTLEVRTLDDYVGRAQIALAQDVAVSVDEVDSQVRLEKGSARLRGYAMKTRFSRTPDNKSLVQLELEQEILTDAPWFAHKVADRRVRASVERSLANQEAAIRRLVAENRDDVPLLPLR